MNKPLTAATIFFLFLTLTNNIAQAAGNHPAAGACPKDKPYYAICTHSLHSLEGWYSNRCHATQQSAQADAEAHAKKWHKGNMRWTGINQQR